MSKPVVVIDGSKFDDIDSFYDEIERNFTHGLTWRIGRNLNAYNDILRGGFGVYEYEEPVKVIWRNYLMSHERLGQEQMEIFVEYLKSHDHIEFEIEE